jgi:Lhr-like helicase
MTSSNLVGCTTGRSAGFIENISPGSLNVRTNQLVRFQAYSSSRQSGSRAGDIAGLLAGAKPDRTRSAEVTIIDTGHQRTRELTLEVPDSPLEAVMSNEVWQQVYDRVVDLIKAHRTTLVFVNTRKMAERVAHELSVRIVDGTITAHHGSMAKEHRLV